MGWRLVRQPNGLLARFSEVVDDFTAYDMTYAEAVEECKQHPGIGQREAEGKIYRAFTDKPVRVHSKHTNRFSEALAFIRAIHGDERADLRRRQLSEAKP